MTPTVPPLPSRNEIEKTINELAAIGPGWAGTAAERRRRDYIHGRLAGAGYEVRPETFPFLAYSLEESASGLTSSALGSFATSPVQYTATGRVEGRLIYIGQGRAEDFAALDAAGVSLIDAICMARTMMPFTMTAELARRGARGLVVHGDAPRDLLAHYAGRGFPPPLERPWAGAVAEIPAVTVTKSNGDRLLAAHGSGAGSVAIEHSGRYLETTTENLVADLPGRSSDFILLAAHYDTQVEGGPWDNGTGLAAVLETARIFRDYELDFGIRFLFVSCEEEIMWGSHAYAQRHREELLQRCRAMINWDAPCTPWPLMRSCFAAPELRPVITAATEAAGWHIEVWEDARDAAITDDAAFHNIGLPTAWFCEYPPPVHPYMHTSGDTVDLVSFEKLTHVTTAGAFLVAALATST